MTKIIMKIGKTIEIDESFIRLYMEQVIIDYVEERHSKCLCGLNESNSCCDCDGDLTEENFEIERIEK